MVIVAELPAIYFVQQPPADVTGHVGGSVHLGCSARSRNLGQVEVTWVKDGGEVVEGDGRRSVTQSGSLVIAPVMSGVVLISPRGNDTTEGDEGVYRCIARQGGVAIVSTPATLHIAS